MAELFPNRLSCENAACKIAVVFYDLQKGRAARQEKEKNECIKEVAGLKLRLNKEYGVEDLSLIAKSLATHDKPVRPLSLTSSDHQGMWTPSVPSTATLLAQ